MNTKMRDLKSAELQILEQAYPTEIAVIREMLAAIEENCFDQIAHQNLAQHRGAEGRSTG